MKKLAHLYLETCCGRLQGGSTLRLVDRETEEVLSETIRNDRKLVAVYRSLIARGMPGEVFTCHGTGGWITNARHDHFDGSSE